MEAIAILRNVPTSPRKMRMVVDMIRGQKVNKALGILKFEARVGADYVEKLLLSAVSNWEAKNEGTKIESVELFVKTIFVGGGKALKRLRPAPQGRAHRIRKRSNHITLVVDALVSKPTIEKMVENLVTTDLNTKE
jgi:large subunit ribosomal protein L22